MTAFFICIVFYIVILIFLVVSVVNTFIKCKDKIEVYVPVNAHADKFPKPDGIEEKFWEKSLRDIEQDKLNRLAYGNSTNTFHIMRSLRLSKEERFNKLRCTDMIINNKRCIPYYINVFDMYYLDGINHKESTVRMITKYTTIEKPREIYIVVFGWSIDIVDILGPYTVDIKNDSLVYNNCSKDKVIIYKKA